MNLPIVELKWFIPPSTEPPPDLPAELPFLPLLPGMWGRTESEIYCSWSVAFDPELERDLPSRPEQAEGRFAELRRGPQSITAEEGPSRATWSEEWAQQQVLDAVRQVAEEYAALAEADGWQPRWEEDEFHEVPVVRHHYCFLRGEWILRIVALSGAYWGGLETSVSRIDAV